MMLPACTAAGPFFWTAKSAIPGANGTLALPGTLDVAPALSVAVNGIATVTAPSNGSTEMLPIAAIGTITPVAGKAVVPLPPVAV